MTLPYIKMDFPLQLCIWQIVTIIPDYLIQEPTRYHIVFVTIWHMQKKVHFMWNIVCNIWCDVQFKLNSKKPALRIFNPVTPWMFFPLNEPYLRRNKGTCWRKHICNWVWFKLYHKSEDANDGIIWYDCTRRCNASLW